MQPRRIKRQRKNKKDEDVNISNSDSTTNNNNNMSESWEGPRRQLNPNPRRSLRYSRRLLEMGATSQPKISTGYSSTSDDIQILDVPATTVNSA